MKSSFAPLILSVLLVTIAAASCGEDAGAPRRPTPSAAAPRNVTAFGARDVGGAFGLYLVQPDGANLRKLRDESAPIVLVTWSPAGDRLAYLVGGEAPGSTAALRIYDFETGDTATVSEAVLDASVGATAAWSPDGTQVAFVEAAGGGRLRRYDLDRGGLVEDTDVSAIALDWSARDELALVGPASDGSDTDVYLADADGGDARPLLVRDGLEGGLRWSPDGGSLALWSAPSARLSERQLVLLEREGGEARDLGPGSDPAWSPDGARLAYSAPAEATGGAVDIFIVAADGRESLDLSQSVTLDRAPTWSAAADAVAYLALADRETGFICLVQLEPEQRDCLDLPGLLPTALAWSPF